MKSGLHPAAIGSIALVLCLTSSGAWAADSVDTINYQGKLVDAQGAPMEDGTYDAMFAIYDTPNPTQGQNAVWTDRQVTLHVLAGVFSVELGDDSPFEGLFTDYDDLYLKITVEGEDMLPLIHLASVPYAMKAGIATTAETVENGTIAGDLLVSGSIGIGEPAPQSPLHLSSVGGIDLIIEADTDDSGEDQNARVVLSQDGGGVTSRLGYRAEQNALEIMQEYDDSLIFGTSNADRLTISSDGVVQIKSQVETGSILELKNTYSPPYTHDKTLGRVDFLNPVDNVSASMYYFYHGTLGAGDTSGLYLATEGSPRMMVAHDGKVGIGTTDPATKLQVSGGGDASLSNGSGYVVIGTEDNRNIVIDENEIMARDNGVASRLYLNAGGGNVVVDVLEITGGADIAEPFRFSDTKAIRPGMVVAIDPELTGHLRIADSAYDRTVAGIISGANGINPGLTMNQKGTIADGSLPVALTGRVYALADASYCAIRPGDLLTTSDTPGHVMRVSDHTKAQGTILGKAMSSLEQGRGLVLVLVTLQ